MADRTDRDERQDRKSDQSKDDAGSQAGSDDPSRESQDKGDASKIVDEDMDEGNM